MRRDDECMLVLLKKSSLRNNGLNNLIRGVIFGKDKSNSFAMTSAAQELRVEVEIECTSMLFLVTGLRANRSKELKVSVFEFVGNSVAIQTAH